MSLQTLMTSAQLRALLATARPRVVLDCGFELSDPSSGERAYLAGHLPGARYVHLDRDLAGSRTGSNGRHPLPTREDFARCVGAWGVKPGVQVVCYDNQGGVYAARAWWMLHWLGHAEVAVLDGGLAAWVAEGGALESAPRPAEPAAPRGGMSKVAEPHLLMSLAGVGRPGPPYPAAPAGMPTVDAHALASQLGRVTLVDARAPERFRGEVEPLDPVAGHIPGAVLRFYKDNLAGDGRFKTVCQLRDDFAPLAALGPVVHQCGSGVTACHNLLAMAHAGLGTATLYPGSWSEWCSDPRRPVARG